MHAPSPFPSPSPSPWSSPARVALTPDGLIGGYASLFGEIDQARDMVMPGAFPRTLKQRGTGWICARTCAGYGRGAG